jgi:hypothetical protein
MPSKEEFLTKAHMQAWSRFLSSPEGQKGILYLRMACPRMFEKTDDALVRNSVGFEFWQQCLDKVEGLGVVPPRPEKPDDDTLER